MDANKAETLRELGYEIRETCSSCAHGEFRTGSIFGLCTINSYSHQKHSKSARHLSVMQQGWCPKYEHSERHGIQTEHFRF